MSAATDSFTETVHVRLLDEGVDVWRPVSARALGNGAFQLSPEAAPADEAWEFPPGATVGVAKRKTAEGEVAIAIAPPRRGHRA